VVWRGVLCGSEKQFSFGVAAEECSRLVRLDKDLAHNKLERR